MATALDMVAQDISQAFNAGYYFAALTNSLLVPHICASLETPNGWSGGTEYRDWCKRYVVAKMGIPADVIYSIRCGFLHQGQAYIAQRQSVLAQDDNAIQRVIFLLPGQFGGCHRNHINDAIQFE